MAGSHRKFRVIRPALVDDRRLVNTGDPFAVNLTDRVASADKRPYRRPAVTSNNTMAC